MVTTSPHYRSAVLHVVTVGQDSCRARLRVSGELDLASAGVLADALEGQLAAGRRYLRVDLSQLRFCDAAGLAVLERGHQRVLAAHGTLLLTGVGARLARLLSLTGLDALLMVTGATDGDLPPADGGDASPPTRLGRT